MSINKAVMSREKILAQLQRNHQTQTDEIRRLKLNIQKMNDVVAKQNRKINVLQTTHTGLQKEHALKREELEAAKEVADAHKDEKEHAHHLLKISQNEHAELKTMHDKLLGLFNAKDPKAFEKALNAEIAKFESMIDQQEADTAAIQKDFNTMEKNFNASVEKEKALQSILDVRDEQIKQYECMNDMHKDKYNELKSRHENVKYDHIAEKNALEKGFEAELNITKKEHAALKDMHDQLLADFNAGDAKQFKRDLNKKIGDFESLIDEQENQIKELKANLAEEYEELNRDLKSILDDPEVESIHSLNEMIERSVTSYNF